MRLLIFVLLISLPFALCFLIKKQSVTGLFFIAKNFGEKVLNIVRNIFVQTVSSGMKLQNKLKVDDNYRIIFTTLTAIAIIVVQCMIICGESFDDIISEKQKSNLNVIIVSACIAFVFVFHNIADVILCILRNNRKLFLLLLATAIVTLVIQDTLILSATLFIVLLAAMLYEEKI